MTIGVAVFALAVLALLICTRPRALTQVLGVDSFTSGEILHGSTWYPFTEREDETHFALDAPETSSEGFADLTELLDGVTVRSSLTKRSFNTVIGAPYSSLSCRWGEESRWLCFNGKYLVVGYGDESTGKLYYVNKADSQALSDLITRHGYNVQEYLSALGNAEN